jgi:hypothetical protein
MSNYLYPSKDISQTEYIKILERHLLSYKQELAFMRKRIRILEEQLAEYRNGDCLTIKDDLLASYKSGE